GQFSRDFFELIPTLKESVIFVVGGTGFYFQAIEQGMYPVKPVKDEVKSKVQEDILKLGFLKIYDWLKERDPEYVVKISANDHYRIERAYELMISEGRSVTDIQREFQAQAKKFPYPLLKVGITGDKEFLLKKVAHRTEKMLHQGLIEEVKSLLTQGYSSWAPLSSVGYREVVEFLEQGRDLDWLSEEIVKNTMKLIKKQKTWFQRDKAIKQINNWSPSEESDIEKNILAELDSFVRCSG
ncbi:MAG: tRNA (adenosine(37)-N6)-dimethylallyltransferase MiaA, partial [Bdellovibrionaceae bacterium]|nr:tRNA (adenosine(37)-N6)-dimethylallyltransferase MiaA [Pseudobdellovibrionaceae bacterium]